MQTHDPETTVVICYVGPIQPPWTQNFRHALCECVNEGLTQATLLLSSSGGSLAEGFALYNLMRSIPVEFHCHNLGAVESIANVVFIAGDRRTAAPQSSFYFHGFKNPFNNEVWFEAEVSEMASHLARQRTEFVNIFESRSKLTAAKFEELKLMEHGKTLGTEQASKLGIVNEVCDLSIPAGVRMWNIVGS